MEKKTDSVVKAISLLEAVADNLPDNKETEKAYWNLREAINAANEAAGEIEILERIGLQEEEA